VSGVVNLDSGATAWCTQEDRVTKTQACLIVLMASTLNGQSVDTYLQSLLDADSRDEYVVKRAGQLYPDSMTKSFEYVRPLGYEA
jgi:hypothetical protein